MLLRHLSAISPSSPPTPTLTSSHSDEDGSPTRPYKSLQWGIAAMQPFADGIRLSLERKAFSKKIYEFQFFQDHKTTQTASNNTSRIGWHKSHDLPCDMVKYRTTWTFLATNRNPVSANVLYIFCIVRSLFCWKADITQCNSDSISNTNTLCVIISRVTKSGATVRADTWGDFWSRPPSVVDQPLKKLHRSINCCTGKAKLIIRYFLIDKF